MQQIILHFCILQEKLAPAKGEHGRFSKLWPLSSHLCLEESPQGPFLLDAFAADVHGHAERQDDDDE